MEKSIYIGFFVFVPSTFVLPPCRSHFSDKVPQLSVSSGDWHFLKSKNNVIQDILNSGKVLAAIFEACCFYVFFSDARVTFLDFHGS